MTEEFTKDQLVRVIVYLGDFVNAVRRENTHKHYCLPDDVADCIDWARGIWVDPDRIARHLENNV